jgi:hypothetical protein
MILKIRPGYWREVLRVLARSNSFGVVGFTNQEMNEKKTTPKEYEENDRQEYAWKKIHIEELISAVKGLGSVSPAG